MARRPAGRSDRDHDGKRRPVKEADRRRGPYPYFGSSGVVNHVDDCFIDGDFLLIAEDGENLRTRQTPIAFMARGKSWVNNYARIVTGAVMPKLTQANLNRVPVVCPPMEEQRAIVSVVGALDDKLELSCRMGETLETVAQSLFRSWFVDFDPTWRAANWLGGKLTT